MNEDARESSRESDERFRSAFEDAPIGMAIVGLDGVVQRTNDRLCRRHRAAPRTSSSARRIDALAPEEDRDGAWPPVAGVEIERRFLCANGDIGWGLWQHSLVHDRDDQPAYWVCHFLDISKRKGVERQLDYQAHHDPLTGLPNRSFFLQRLQRGDRRSGDARGRGPVRRPRQLQDHQRLARPRGRRPPARGRRRAPAPRAAPRRRDRPLRRRRVRRDDPRLGWRGRRPPRRRPPGQRPARAGRARRPPALRDRELRRARRCRSASPTRRRCCATPTPPCTARRSSARRAARSSTTRCARRPPSGSTSRAACATRSSAAS